MGWGKKFKKAGKSVGKTASSAVKTSTSAVESLANDLAKQGSKLYQETGKIEGLVEKGYDVTRKQLNEAVAALGELSQELMAFVEGLALELYKQAIKPFVKEANAIQSGACALASTTGNILVDVGTALANGRYEQAVDQTLKALQDAGSDFHRFCADNKPFHRASLLVGADLALSAGAGSASGSVGLTVDLEILDGSVDSPVLACIFVSEGAALGTPSNPVEASYTVGFVRGKPKNVAGDAIDLGIQSFGFGFPFIKTLLGQPSLNSITVSMTLAELVEEAVDPTPLPAEPSKWSVSLGGSMAHILQTIKGKDTGKVGPGHRSRLDGSQWRKGNGDLMQLVFTKRNKNKKRDRYSVLLNGEQKGTYLWKIDRYDKNDMNLNAYSAGGANVAYGRVSRDGNELVLSSKPVGDTHTWRRWESDAQ